MVYSENREDALSVFAKEIKIKDRRIKEMNMRRKTCLALMIVWMAVIFTFSARPADESEEDSLRVGMLLGRIFVPEFEEWSREKQYEFAEKVDHPVRKTAHASEYAVLGLLAAGICIRGGEEERRYRRDLFLPWGIAAAYAATDEFHQLFVPGRSGQVSDVLLDSAGALAGLLLLTGIRKYRRKKT